MRINHANVYSAADVDVELLTAELPPVAYTDPGFVQFLRSTIRD